MNEEPTMLPRDTASINDTNPRAGSTPSRHSADREGASVVVPGYDLRERLGRGGFALVYRAYQTAFDRDVAVKVLLGDLSDPADARQFTNECRALGRLSSHPAVVDVFDAGTTTDGRGYIVMRLYAGGSMAQRVSDTGPLPIEEVLEVGMRMADALASAHSQQVIHRDIKPENILIDETGRTALSDFGVAAMADPSGRFTRSLAFSRQHVAPEVLERNSYGVASDIYGLSSTLYAMCAGRPPFQYSAEATQIAAILSEPVPPIARADMPADLMDLLVTGLAKDPRDRFRDARALHHALRTVRASLAGAPAAARAAAIATPVQNVPPVPQATPAHASTRWTVIIGAGLAGVLVGAALLLLLAG